MIPSELLPLVYDEVWLKLDDESLLTRSGFIRASTVAMRRILVDHARSKKAAKRGGERLRADLDPQRLPGRQVNPDVEAIDAALERLAVTQPRIVELVQLRYFVGLTIPEAAAVLDISPRTANAWWAYARGWLGEELKK